MVIVDNGRSRMLGGKYEQVLSCIRCGACLDVCPVYRKIGGHAYDAVYTRAHRRGAQPVARRPRVPPRAAVRQQPVRRLHRGLLGAHPAGRDDPRAARGRGRAGIRGAGVGLPALPATPRSTRAAAPVARARGARAAAAAPRAAARRAAARPRPAGRLDARHATSRRRAWRSFRAAWARDRRPRERDRRRRALAWSASLLERLRQRRRRRARAVAPAAAPRPPSRGARRRAERATTAVAACAGSGRWRPRRDSPSSSSIGSRELGVDGRASWRRGAGAAGARAARRRARLGRRRLCAGPVLGRHRRRVDRTRRARRRSASARPTGPSPRPARSWCAAAPRCGAATRWCRRRSGFFVPEPHRADARRRAARAADRPALPSCVSFISGPSSTSDLAAVHVVGVHGPGEVFVWVIDEADGHDDVTGIHGASAG